MIKNHRYGERDIILSKGGTRITTGILRAREAPSNDAIEITNSISIDLAKT